MPSIALKRSCTNYFICTNLFFSLYLCIDCIIQAYMKDKVDSKTKQMMLLYSQTIIVLCVSKKAAL